MFVRGELYICALVDRTFRRDKTLVLQKADVQHVSFEVTVERSRGVFCGAFAGLERTSAGIHRNVEWTFEPEVRNLAGSQVDSNKTRRTIRG